MRYPPPDSDRNSILHRATANEEVVPRGHPSARSQFPVSQGNTGRCPAVRHIVDIAPAPGEPLACDRRPISWSHRTHGSRRHRAIDRGADPGAGVGLGSRVDSQCPPGLREPNGRLATWSRDPEDHLESFPWDRRGVCEREVNGESSSRGPGFSARRDPPRGLERGPSSGSTVHRRRATTPLNRCRPSALVCESSGPHEHFPRPDSKVGPSDFKSAHAHGPREAR